MHMIQHIRRRQNPESRGQRKIERVLSFTLINSKYREAYVLKGGIIFRCDPLGNNSY